MTVLKIVNAVITILIAVCGLYYLCAGAHNGEVVYIAAGWAMLTYARQELLYEDVREIKDEIKKFKK